MKRLLLVAALIAWSGMASAVVYKWVDAQGKVQYGDRPPDGGHAEGGETLGNENRGAQQHTGAPSPAPGPRCEECGERAVHERAQGSRGRRRRAGPREGMHRGAGTLP